MYQSFRKYESGRIPNSFQDRGKGKVKWNIHDVSGKT